MADDTIPLSKLERYKSIYEYMRHITTLSTGSLILSVTFLEKVFPQEQRIGNELLVTSLCSFMVSIIASVFAYTFYIFDFPSKKSLPKWIRIIGTYWLAITLLSFLIGVVFLTIFAVQNLMLPNKKSDNSKSSISKVVA